MTATFVTARDDIFTLFKAVWDTTGHPVGYPDRANQNIPPSTVIPWARVSLSHVGATQAVLSDDTSGKRFTRTGIFTVQIFSPIGDGNDVGYALAQTVADGIQGKATTNQVWFRNVRVNEVGPSGAWFQINVIADFEYDQFVSGV